MLLDDLTESRAIRGVAYVCTSTPFPRSSQPYAHLQAPESYVILLRKRCTSSGGVYLLQRMLLVYRSYSPFRGGADPGVVLRMELFTVEAAHRPVL